MITLCKSQLIQKLKSELIKEKLGIATIVI